MVFAFAGDSTITSFVVAATYLFLLIFTTSNYIANQHRHQAPARIVYVFTPFDTLCRRYAVPRGSHRHLEHDRHRCRRPSGPFPGRPARPALYGRPDHQSLITPCFSVFRGSFPFSMMIQGSSFILTPSQDGVSARNLIRRLFPGFPVLPGVPSCCQRTAVVSSKHGGKTHARTTGGGRPEAFGGGL